MAELMHQMRDPAHTLGGSVGSIPQTLIGGAGGGAGGHSSSNGALNGIHATPATSLKMSEAMRHAQHDASPNPISSKMKASQVVHARPEQLLRHGEHSHIHLGAEQPLPACGHLAKPHALLRGDVRGQDSSVPEAGAKFLHRRRPAQVQGVRRAAPAAPAEPQDVPQQRGGCGHRGQDRQ
ncbi:GL20614 [Drosophila persimilis]|uniref:GL20614 n=1 Tax=Drosophila persimilis TaxID=7234 RepID=B4G484_DROPE|nr:GL20614 [Drosophila persimilis]